MSVLLLKKKEERRYRLQGPYIPARRFRLSEQTSAGQEQALVDVRAAVADRIDNQRGFAGAP